MDTSGDEEAILQEIQRLVTAMTSSNITHADICDYNMSKHQIISNSRNIYLLINILKNNKDLSNQVVLEILNIVHSIISFYQTNFDLHFILSELIQCDVEDIALVQTLGKSITFISFLIFLSEKEFVLPIDESRDSISPLEAFVFENFLNYFSSYCNQESPEIKEIKDNIKEKYIPLFVQLCIKLLFTQPLEAVAILRASLFFGIDQSKPILQKLDKKCPIELFYPQEIFQCLSQIAVTGPDDRALDALAIVTVISNSIHYHTYSQLVENIQQFILTVLEDESILDNQAKAIEIQNLLIYTNPESKDHPFDDIIQFLYQFTQKVLQNSPLLLTIIYPGILTFFRAFKGNFSKKGFHSEFLEGMKGGLIQYVDTLLNSFDVNPEETIQQVYEIQNLKQITQSLKRLLEFSDLKTIHLYIRDKTFEIVNDDLTVINSYKISFILIVLNSCYIKFDLFLKEGRAILFDLLFQLLPIMRDKLPQYSQLANSTGTSFYIAKILLQDISNLLNEIFITINQSKFFESFKEYCENSNVVEIISIIFDFLIFMIQNDLETRPASIVMKDILKSENLCQRLATETNFPNYFLENYTSMPCKDIFSFALIKLVCPDPQKRETFFNNLTEYLTQLITIQQGEDDQSDKSENFIQFFEIISTFFDSFLESNKWFEFFEYVFTHFGETIEKISNSDFLNYVLEFIARLTEDGDRQMHLPKNIDNFPTTSPYTFQIFKFFCLLLTNILKNTNLSPIETDESIFLSPIPTSDIYLNAIQVSNEIESEEWLFLSKNIRAMNWFLISPFPNFAIMKYYQDICLIEYFDFLIQQIHKTSPVSLLSISYVLDQLMTFIRLFSKSYFDIILDNEPFLTFALDISKIAFLSNNFNTLNNACFTLEILCRNTNCLEPSRDTTPLKQLFDQYYVLALNLLTISIEESKESDSTSSQSEKDSAGLELDLECCFSEVKKNASSFIYSFLCYEIEFADEMNARIVEGIAAEETKKEIGEVLTNLIKCPLFTGIKEDKDKFDEYIKDLIVVAYNNSFRLDYLPSMTEFFMFK